MNAAMQNLRLAYLKLGERSNRTRVDLNRSATESIGGSLDFLSLQVKKILECLSNSCVYIWRESLSRFRNEPEIRTLFFSFFFLTFQVRVLVSGTRGHAVHILACCARSEPSDSASDGSDYISIMNNSWSSIAEMRFGPSENTRSDGCDHAQHSCYTQVHSNVLLRSSFFGAFWTFLILSLFKFFFFLRLF